MSERGLVAIHQPNFFPWLGYFHKLATADVFVLLDDAQFPKTGGTWINRVRCLVSGRAAWLTLSVDRSYHGVRRIMDMRAKNDERWRTATLRTLATSYARAPHFREVEAALRPLLEDPEDRLAELNIRALTTLAGRLGLLDSCRLVRSSALGVEAGATERLVQLVSKVGGRAYLCGGGAAGYQEDEAFPGAGLELVYQRFQHPRYPQVGATEFVPGLSIIDALMNCGFDGTRRLLLEPASG